MYLDQNSSSYDNKYMKEQVSDVKKIQVLEKLPDENKKSH